MKRAALRSFLVSLVLLLSLSINALAGTYIASRKSNKYHYPTCKSAQRIKPENRIIFNSAKEARDAGYIPCKICKPPLTE